MIKRGIINLGKTLCKIFLLALIPVLLMIKFKWDGILPVIIYLQFLLIWAQAEIGMKQHFLFSAQFNPSFSVKLGSIAVDNATITYSVYIKNTSKNPAYNIMVGRVLNEQNNPIPPDEWKGKVSSCLISSLAPEEEKPLINSAEKTFFENKIIEVSYTNLFGEWRVIYIKFLEGQKLLFIPERMQKPGILLNTFEDLILFSRYYKFCQRYLKPLKQHAGE